MLGIDPDFGLEVSLRAGRFGPYVQLGAGAEGEKPKRAGLPRGTEAAAVDLEMALKLLSLPREVGPHPEDGEPIRAGIGRFGAYVQHGKTYANLEPGDDVLNIGLNRAVALIADKVAKGPRARFGADPGRSLGDHPEKGGAVLVKAGRYGPYVSHDGVNATLPKDKPPEAITLDEAVVLLAARAAQGGEGRGARRGKAAKPAGAAAGEEEGRQGEGRGGGRWRGGCRERPKPRRSAPRPRRSQHRRRGQKPAAAAKSEGSRLPRQNRPQKTAACQPRQGREVTRLPKAHGFGSLTICP